MCSDSSSPSYPRDVSTGHPSKAIQADPSLAFRFLFSCFKKLFPNSLVDTISLALQLVLK